MKVLRFQGDGSGISSPYLALSSVHLMGVKLPEHGGEHLLGVLGQLLRPSPQLQATDAQGERDGSFLGKKQ